MIQKQTWLHIADNTTVKWLQIFHLYKGFSRRVSYPGHFVKGSARVVSPPQIEYKGFKFKFNSKGDICRSIFVRSYQTMRNNDSSKLSFNCNSGVLIKKRQIVKSKYLFGPVPRLIRRKKIQLLFKVTV